MTVVDAAPAGTRAVRPPAAGDRSVPRPAPHPRLVLLVVSAGVFLANLDLFIVNIAFPDIRAAFPGTSLGQLSWVLNGYTVVFAALLAITGRLADRYGRRRLFLAGLALFTAASAACATSVDPAMLIAFRVLQAGGAALVVPTSLALVLAAYPAQRRASAVGTWAAIGGAAAALGPPAGGVMVEFGWRWIFLVNVPVGLVALVAGTRVLPEGRSAEVGVPDLRGCAALIGAVGALAWALVTGPAHGWTDSATLIGFADAVVLVVVVVDRSATHPHPVLDLTVLQVRQFVLACLAMLSYGAAFAAMLLQNVLVMTEVWHWGVLRSGLALFPGPATAATVSFLSARAVRRFGPGLCATAGAVSLSVSACWWIWSVGPTPHYPAMLVGLLLSGAGVGLTLPPLSGTVGAALPAARWGAGSSMINSLRQIGTVIGTSVVVGTAGRGLDLDHARVGWMFVNVAAIAAALAAAFLALSSRRAPARSGT